MDLKIQSINICHTLNTSGIIDLLKTEKPDMLFLQEVPHTSEELNCAMKSIDYYAYTSLIDGERPGVGVIFKNCLEISDIYALHPGRLLKVKMGHLMEMYWSLA